MRCARPPQCVNGPFTPAQEQLLAYRDLYNVLGIERTASQDEVKKAYRRLALQWHPDRTNNDPDAAARFKEVSFAYKVLSDAEERAKYDRLGPLYTADGRPPRPEDLNETLSGVVGRWFGRKAHKKGEDLKYTLTLSLEEVAAGSQRKVVVPRRARCRTCGGDGAAPGGKQPCNVCDGSGRSKGVLLRGDCFHCDGRGFTVKSACASCDGDGRTPTDDEIQVTVPLGVATGQKLRVAGKGNAPVGSGPEGDLLIVINVADHPLFVRRGEDLVVEMPTTFAELALGAEVTIPTLDGSTTIRIPPGTPPGRIFRLSGRGLPRAGRSGRGDLHVQVALEVPEGLSPVSQADLERWVKSLPHEAHPRRRTFDDAVRAR
jgi:molecular chaperone DnaJ